MITFVLSNNYFFSLSVKNKELLLKENEGDSGDIKLKMSPEDLEYLLQGKTTGNKLFMQGKIKVEGDMSKAAMLDDLVKEIKKMLTESKY